jgi:demethylmenaquinone methyltransferase/2-methoxy-6-polyprenyl-1,4-benzoquinol methylase
VFIVAAMSDSLLAEQVAYYRARAGEYDDWWFRRGRYDWGAVLNQRWFGEATLVRRELHARGHFEDTLELACGTGLWTEQLLTVSSRITALDASPEVIAINRARIAAAAPVASVTYIPSDLFAWQPDRQFDLAACCFWLSHVPPDKLDEFLDKLHRATRPGGTLFFVDSLNQSTSMAKDHDPPAVETGVRVRKLADGRQFRVVKVYYEPAAFTATLARHGFDATVKTSGAHFLYGFATRK